jgi:hypothetical protein
MMYIMQEYFIQGLFPVLEKHVGDRFSFFECGTGPTSA